MLLNRIEARVFDGPRGWVPRRDFSPHYPQRLASIRIFFFNKHVGVFHLKSRHGIKKRLPYVSRRFTGTREKIDCKTSTIRNTCPRQTNNTWDYKYVVRVRNVFRVDRRSGLECTGLYRRTRCCEPRANDVHAILFSSIYTCFFTYTFKSKNRLKKKKKTPRFYTAPSRTNTDPPPPGLVPDCHSAYNNNNNTRINTHRAER